MAQREWLWFTHAMLFGAVVMPILMVVGVIAAWKMPKREGRRREGEPDWRDTSLDDWRKERDEQQREEREARHASGEPAIRDGAERESSEPARHQRIGG